MLTNIVEAWTFKEMCIRDSIIDCAFTHTSYANEHKSKHIHHNQRLEFLGDAVLDLIIGEYLFKNYPDMAAGNLTKIKAATVCEDSLASVSYTHLDVYKRQDDRLS